MQSPCKISNIHEIVVDRSCLDEGTLITGDLAIHERLQLQCQDFCDDFGNAMNETYWPVVTNPFCTFFFGTRIMFAVFSIVRLFVLRS